MQGRRAFRGSLKRPALLALVSAIWVACGRPPAPPAPPPPQAAQVQALEEVGAEELPAFRDDQDASSLRIALKGSLAYLGRLPPDSRLHLGELEVKADRVRRSLTRFDQLLASAASFAQLQAAIAREFAVYRARSAGPQGNGPDPPVLFTGYYEPVVAGRRRADARFRYPLYRRPDDLLELDLGEFVPRLAGEKLIYRIDRGRVRPYFTRAQIERQAVLQGRGLELFFLADPVERFFLQVQGSGVLRLDDGTRQRIGYAASNGLPYTSVGKLLIEDGVLPKDQVSMQRIEEAFRRMPERISSYLERNERFIFFREVEQGPIGSLGEVLTPGRSLAADPQVLPAAALAYFRVPRPELLADGTVGAGAPLERFAFIQDRGSAIVGPRRIDLFCGTGSQAGALAGRLRHRGELYVLLLR